MSDVGVKREQSPTPELAVSPTKKIKTEEETGRIDFDLKCETIESEEIHLKDEIKEEPSTSTIGTSDIKHEENTVKCGPSTSSNSETQNGKDDFSKTLASMDQMRPKKKVKVVKGQKTEITDNHILQFNIHLMRGRGAPKIWRRFQVPATYTFRQFHIAIQKAMGWKSIEYDYHLHSFSVVNPATGHKESILMTEDVKYHSKFDSPKDENQTKIKDYFYMRNHKGRYLYDFGCCWEHEFVFEKALLPVEGEKYPKCIDGAKACPPEDETVHSDEEYDSDEFNAEACFGN